MLSYVFPVKGPHYLSKANNHSGDLHIMSDINTVISSETSRDLIKRGT